ncbi:MAG TPA: 16S rRNA (uracil(1498)-N(3))-methyltransferase [Bauldia sp.]|nr:16S rRNA (uracil(1498)-N(3))-methyltransferase [Bauldia sp.]
MQRLFVRAVLAPGARVDLDRAQAHYLVHVLRLEDGAALLVFNGRDGEFRATLSSAGRRNHTLEIGDQVRLQPPTPDLRYLFAPLKHARLDYMVEKATEMGVARITPVLTQHGQVARVNRERMEANAIEAAEQCGILTIPRIDEPTALGTLLAAWPNEEPRRRLIFCDEGDGGADPLSILAKLAPSPLAVLVGPEGGFSDEERLTLRALSFVTPLPLGPRILRADTAAVAALALVQAALGDWRT